MNFYEVIILFTTYFSKIYSGLGFCSFILMWFINGYVASFPGLNVFAVRQFKKWKRNYGTRKIVLAPPQLGPYWLSEITSVLKNRLGIGQSGTCLYAIFMCDIFVSVQDTKETKTDIKLAWRWTFDIGKLRDHCRVKYQKSFFQCCCSLHHSIAAVLRNHRRHVPT